MSAWQAYSEHGQVWIRGRLTGDVIWNYTLTGNQARDDTELSWAAKQYGLKSWELRKIADQSAKESNGG